MAKKIILANLDLNQNQILNVSFQNVATDPASPTTGQFLYNSSSNKPKFYNGSAWKFFDSDAEPFITDGTTAQYRRGDKTWQTLNTSVVPEVTNLYYTAARVNAQVNTFTGDLTSTGTVNTLKTVNTNVGTFGNASTGKIPSFSVNGKGLITAASETVIPTHTIFGQNFNCTQNVAGVATVSGIAIQNGAKTVNLTVDATGNLIVDGNIYGEGEISAYGVGTGGTGGGGLIATVLDSNDFGTTFLNTDLTNTFNAYSINSLYNRIITLEGGSAATINVIGSGNAITDITKTGTTITATKGSTFLTGNQNITVSGDLTGAGTTGLALTLATVNSNTGSFGGTTAIPIITVNGKGLVTAVSTSAVVAPAGTLSGTILNSSVVSSSLTTVGTIGTGTWQGSLVAGQFGGTGVNNNGKTITLGGNLTTSGAYATTITTTAATTVTLPTSGTLYGTLSNSITSNQLGNSLSDCTGNVGSTGKVMFNLSPTILTSVIAGSTSMDIFNTVATTLNFAGAATTLNIGVAAGTTTIKSNLIVSGDLTINGTTTTINATTLAVDDKNIELGSVASPTDTTATGGGLTLKGTTDKTFNWLTATSAWTSSENIDLVTGHSYKIGGVDVLSVNSTTTQIGGTNGLTLNNSNKTITAGIWAGSVIGVAYGGTSYNDAKGGIARKVVGSIATTGSTYSIAHGLTSGVVAQIYETVSGAVVDCEIVTQTAGTTVFNFNSNVVSGFYSYCIIG